MAISFVATDTMFSMTGSHLRSTTPDIYQQTSDREEDRSGPADQLARTQADPLQSRNADKSSSLKCNLYVCCNTHVENETRKQTNTPTDIHKSLEWRRKLFRLSRFCKLRFLHKKKCVVGSITQWQGISPVNWSPGFNSQWGLLPCMTMTCGCRYVVVPVVCLRARLRLWSWSWYGCSMVASVIALMRNRYAFGICQVILEYATWTLHICITFCAVTKAHAFGICKVILEYAKWTLHICITYWMVTKGHSFGICQAMLKYAEWTFCIFAFNIARLPKALHSEYAMLSSNMPSVLCIFAQHIARLPKAMHSECARLFWNMQSELCKIASNVEWLPKAMRLEYAKLFWNMQS